MVEAPMMAAKKRKAPDKEWEVKPIVVQLRGSAGFKAAVEDFAASEGKSVSAMVDHAIRLYAREAGYKKQIPMR